MSYGYIESVISLKDTKSAVRDGKVGTVTTTENLVEILNTCQLNW